VRDLALVTTTHEDALYRLLRTLASMGVFAEEEGRSFRLTPMAELLLTDVPGSLRVAAEVVGEEWNWRPWGALLHSVETGETAFDHLYGESTWDWFAEHPAAARMFDQHMDANTSADAEAIVAAFDFSGRPDDRRCRGRTGRLLTGILRRHTSARGITFSLPAVIESSRGLLGLTEPAAGSDVASMRSTARREGDLYVLKNILHDWDDARARDILAACRRAMGGPARLLIIEHVVGRSNQSCAGTIGDIQMMVRSGGRNRTAEELRELLAACGFHLRRIIPTGGGPDIVEAQIQDGIERAAEHYIE
jgi:hypothetical protein